jgi:hypothetical protein
LWDYWISAGEITDFIGYLGRAAYRGEVKGEIPVYWAHCRVWHGWRFKREA